MLSLVTVALIWLSGFAGTVIAPVEALMAHPRPLTYDSRAASTKSEACINSFQYRRYRLSLERTFEVQVAPQPLPPDARERRFHSMYRDFPYRIVEAIHLDGEVLAKRREVVGEVRLPESGEPTCPEQGVEGGEVGKEGGDWIDFAVGEREVLRDVEIRNKNGEEGNCEGNTNCLSFAEKGDAKVEIGRRSCCERLD